MFLGICCLFVWMGIWDLRGDGENCWLVVRGVWKVYV